MNLSLTFPVTLLPSQTNTLYETSSDYEEQLDLAATGDVVEAIEVGTNRKVHYIFNKEIRKLFERYHRYGNAENDQANLFSSKARSGLSALFGSSSVFSVYSDESKTIRSAIVEYIHQNVDGPDKKKIEAEWTAIAEKHIEDWTKKGKVKIGHALADLRLEMTAKTLLGYQGVCNGISKTLELMNYTIPSPSLKEVHQIKRAGFVQRALFSVRQYLNKIWMSTVQIYGIILKKFTIDPIAKKVVASDSKFAAFLREKGFSDQAIEDNFFSVLIAGQAAMPALLTTVIENYIQHPEFQILDNHEILTKAGQPIHTLEGPKKMILECLRRYPQGGVNRFLRHNAILKYGDKTHYFRKGDEVAWYAMPTTRDSPFENPKEFDRDRPGLENLPQVPYGTGVHVCPGKRLVMPEALLILSALLKKAEVFRVEPMPAVSITLLGPKKDYYVGVKALN